MVSKKYIVIHTLQPPDLGSWAVSFLVSRGDAEYDRWFSGGVDVRRAEGRLRHHASVGLAAVYTHKRELWFRGFL